MLSQHVPSALMGLRLQRSMMFATCSIVHAVDVPAHIAKSESWKLKLQSPGMQYASNERRMLQHLTSVTIEMNCRAIATHIIRHRITVPFPTPNFLHFVGLDRGKHEG
jgi:hypothetical protein